MKNRLVLTLLAVGLTIQATATAQATTASQDELARAAFYRAYKEANSGEYDKAVADFTEVIRLKPDFAEAFYSRGNVYAEFLKQYDKAVADFTEAIRLKPDFAYAFNNRGLTYEELKQYDKAIADFTEAIRLKPDLAYAFNNRGHAYDDLKQYDKAIADFTEAIRLKAGFVGDPKHVAIKPDLGGIDRKFRHRGHSLTEKLFNPLSELLQPFTEAISFRRT